MNNQLLIRITLGIFLVLSSLNFTWVQPAQARNQPIIVTVVGNGTPGYLGDGGMASAARLNSPSAIVFDDKGNMYIADSSNHCVRKISTNGFISTFAGNGTQGYSGDGGPAASAQLYSPKALAIDSSGNLYIADLLGYCVRKVDTQGNISTFAGTGISGYSGDGGVATTAKLRGTFGLIADKQNNIYISDFTRIRKVDPIGIIRTFAGTGGFDHTGYGGPASLATLGAAFELALDSNSNLYFADNGNNCISKIDSAGNIFTIAGIGIPNEGGYSGDGGPATSAKLNRPQGVSFDNEGNMYIADTFNHCIRKVDKTGVISTIIGNGSKGYLGDGGPAISACLNAPSTAVFDASGNMYIADSANHCVRKIVIANSEQKSSNPDNDTSLNKKDIQLTIGSSKMLVGGIEKDIDPGYFTVPEIVRSRTYVPIRAIVENMGGTVGWNENDQTVTIKLNDIQILLQIGSTHANINSLDKNLDDAPYVSSTNRTMLPVRFISENLGYDVIWDEINNTILITEKSLVISLKTNN